MTSPSTMPRPWSRSTEHTVLVLIILLAALLRFWDLDRTSIFHDEGMSFYQSNRGLFDVLRETAKDNYPPLHNLLLWLTIKLLGTSETVLRLPSAILGVAAVYAIYRVAELCGPRGSGLIAAGLMALFPIHIWHSVEVRMYSLLTVAGICFVWVTLVHFRKPTRQTAILCMATSWVLLMSHVYGSFAVASIFAYVFAVAAWTRSLSVARYRNWLLSQITAGILFLPWIVVLLGRTASMHSSGFWIPSPTPEFVFRHLVSLFGPVLLIGLALLAIAAIYRIARCKDGVSQASGDNPTTCCTGLVLSWLIGPFVLAVILSLAVVPILYNRYLLVAAPAGLVLIACGIMRLQTTSLVKVCAALIVIGTQLPMAWSYAFTHHGERHDFRSAARYMMSHYRQGDFFVPVESFYKNSFAYYSGNLTNVVQATSPGAYAVPPDKAERVWLIFSWGGAALKTGVIENYVASGFSVAVDKNYHGISLVLMNK